MAEFVQFSETYAARIAAGIAPFDLTKLEVKIHMRISQSGVPATLWATHAGRQGLTWRNYVMRWPFTSLILA